MKQTLINKYIELLDGAFTYDNEVIPCSHYRIDPDNKSPYYILLTTYNEDTDTPTKCGDTWVCSILVDIVTNFTAGWLRTEVANTIRKQLINTIKAMQLPGLESITIIEDTDVEMLTSAKSVYRNLIRFEHRININ